MRNIDHIGSVSVTSVNAFSTGNNCPSSSKSFTVTVAFNSCIGDLPLLDPSQGTAIELVKGKSSFVDGRANYSEFISRPYFTTCYSSIYFFRLVIFRNVFYHRGGNAMQCNPICSFLSIDAPLTSFGTSSLILWEVLHLQYQQRMHETGWTHRCGV